MNVERFPNQEQLSTALAELLATEVCRESDAPRLVMLAGGKTPLAAYKIVADGGHTADADLHLCLSDERLVPTDSPESNTGHLTALVYELNVTQERRIFPDTHRLLPDAAQTYHNELATFLARGGQVTLGLLGLGADGHTASLFSLDDIERGHGRYAIPVQRENGPHRISVTADFLALTERLIFVAAGAEKQAMLWRLCHEPETIPAGAAVARAPRVECWFAE
jgi:6-phosphogluconolactonase/glucosamine-6-phosphate isomerase/deaminase